MSRIEAPSHPLRNQVVVIAGASSGIGRAAALQLAATGCRLVLATRRQASLRETAAQCEQHGGTAHAVATDVTDEADVDRLRMTRVWLRGRDRHALARR